MPALRLESNALLLYDPDKSRTTVHCFVANPTPLEERMLGRLFLLIELNSADPSQHQLIDILQRELQSQYYQSEDFQIEVAFERALQRLNERMQELLGQQLTAWIGKASMLIGVVKETNLHFSVIGRMHAFLIHRQRILDIIETSAGSTSETPNPLKIFTNIVSGHLSLSDSLLFCTTSLLDYLSQEKLKRLVTENSPEDAVQAIERLLAESDGSIGFGGVILKLATAPEKTEIPAVTPQYTRDAHAEARPQRSMDELIRREQKTNELLNHPLWPNVGRMMKTGAQQLGSAMGSLVKKGEEKEGAVRKVPVQDPEMAETYQEPAQEQPRAMFHNKQKTVAYGAIAAKTGKTVLAGLAVVVSSIGALVRPKGPRGVPRSANRSIAHAARSLQTMTAGRRRILLAAVVLIILFAQSVVSMGAQKQKKQESTQFEQSLASARDDVNTADSALLIKNESGARKALQDANDALATIPASQKNLQSQVQEVRGQIDSRLQQLRHGISVEPSVLYDLASLDVGFTPQAFTLLDNIVYAFNGRNSSLYKIPLDTKSSELLVDSPSLEKPMQTFVAGTAAPTILQTNGSLQLLDTKTKKLSTLALTYPATNAAIQDGVIYNKRLYTIDSANNQVYRNDATATGYAAGKAWLTAPSTDLQNARSMAIDGSIYVVNGSGKILHFTNGKPDAITFDTADPALSDPKAIYTSIDTTTVFVLDPANKRVLEYDKKGAFLRQYTSDKLGDGKDILVDKGTVYVLSGTQLVTFPVTTK